MKSILSILCLLIAGSVQAATTAFPNQVIVPSIRITNGPAAVGQILTATSTDGSSAWSNAPAGSGSGSVTTNANQFGATTNGQLSIKEGARLTNVLFETIGFVFMVGGDDNGFFGISNRTTGRWSFYNPEGSADSWSASGNLVASNGQFTTMPGSGSYVAASAVGSLFRTNAPAGSGTPGGSTFSVQWNTNSTFTGDTNVQIYPGTYSGDPQSALLMVNWLGATNFMAGNRLGAWSSNELGLATFNVIRWRIGVDGHLYPATSGSYNIGSASNLPLTNFMTYFWLPTAARKNAQLRSVGVHGAGVWGNPAAGGNGNTTGGAEPFPGAIQFAQTNVADTNMMIDSTNLFRYVREHNELIVTNTANTSNTVIGAGYIKTGLLEASNLHLANIVVTNGIPGAGSDGHVQYRKGGILAGEGALSYDDGDDIFSAPIVLLNKQMIYTVPTITVVGANSNQTLWVGTTNTVEMLVSTNMTFTNYFSALVAGQSATYLAFMKVTNSAGNIGVNWGLGAGYGRYIFTNANNPIWTTLTNTKTYVASWTFRGTNGHLRLSLEE